MDMPPFVYHQRDHSRYIPVASPAPPHPFFLDDHNFRLPPNHHQIHQYIPEKAVDFPLPPPPTPSYPHFPMHLSTSPAPALAYNPSQPQFVRSSTNHDDPFRVHDDRLRSMHPLREFARSPPVSSRISFNGGFHTNHESRLDISDPSRVTVDNRSSVPHSPVDFEHGMYHRGIDYRPILPYSCLGSEYNDRFQTNPTEDVVRGRADDNYYHHDHIKTDPGISFMEPGATIVQSGLCRDNELTLGSFDRNGYGSTCKKELIRGRRNNVMSKKQRRVHNKQTFRSIQNSLLEMGNNVEGDSDRYDFRTMSGKHGHSRPELRNYYNENKGTSESYHEYTSSPRKQIQKKSAFLRIQVANPCHHGNRESEQLHDSDCFENKNSYLRGRNHVRSLGYRMDEMKKREGSPMELDVSFKSNSLVAKAIVASSQSGAASNVDVMSRNEKITEILAHDSNFPDSRLARKKKDTVGTDGVIHRATCFSGSKNEIKEPEGKGARPLVDNISNNSTEATLAVRNYSLGKTNVESSSQGKSLGKEEKNVFGKAPMRPMKKKKVVRKVVKKAVSHELSSQTKKSDGEPVEIDSVLNIPPVFPESNNGLELPKMKIPASGMNSVHHSVTTASQQEISRSLENRKADQSVLPIASENFEAKADHSLLPISLKESVAKAHMGKKCTPEDDSDRNNSDHPLILLTKEGRGTHDHSDRNISLLMQPILKSKDFKLVDGPNEFGSDGVESSRFVLGEIEDSLLDDVSGKDSEVAMSSLGGSQFGLLSSKDQNPCGNLVNGNSLAGSSYISSDSDSGVIYSHDNAPLSVTCFVDEISKQFRSNKVTVLPKTDNVVVCAAEVTISNSLVDFSNAEEAGMQIDSINSRCYNSNQRTKQDSDDSNCTNIRVNDTLFNYENIGSTSEQSNVDSGSELLAISYQERSPKSKVSASCGEGEKSMSKMSDTKNCLDSATHSDINEETKNVEDTCSFISKDCCPSGHEVSGLRSVVLCANPSTTGDSLMHGYSSVGKFPEDKLLVDSNVNIKHNEKSPECPKKRKICFASQGLPCPRGESNPGPAVTFTSRSEYPLTSNSESMEREEVAASNVDALYRASSTDCLNRVSMMLDDTIIKKSFNKINIDNDPFEYGLKHKHPEKNSCPVKELIVSEFRSLYPLALENEQDEKATSITATNQIGPMDIDFGRKRKLHVHVTKENSMDRNETAQCKFFSEVPSSQTFNCSHAAPDNVADNLGLDNLHYLQNHIDLSDDGSKYFTANCHSEIMGSTFDAQLDLGPPETSSVLGIQKSSCEASLSHIDFKMDCVDDKKADEKPVVENELRALTDTSFSQSTAINQKLSHTDVGKSLSACNVLGLTSEESKNRVQIQFDSTDSRKRERKGSYKSQIFPSKSFSTYVASKKVAPATHGIKPRSWHRNAKSLVPLPGNKVLSNTVLPQGHLHGRGETSHSAYIRKGNSLVRKSSPAATRVWGSHDFSSNSSDQHDCNSSIKAHNKVDVTTSFLFKSRGTDTPVDKPYSSPISIGSKSPNYSISLRDPARSPCHETESDLMKSKHISDLSRSVVDPLNILLAPGSQTVCAHKMDNQLEAKDMSSISSIVKRIVYVKRKSNQLVAASNPSDLSTKNMDAVHSSYSGGYYKRNKNQLIRASVGCQMKRTLLPSGDISNSGARSSSGDGDGRSFYKRQLCKAKTQGPIKSSLVWTLCSSVAPGNGDGNLQNQMISPCLFPWKRTYWRTLKSHTPTHKNSSSSIARKLLLLRNRNTVYKRSKYGFSLRKSKVLSVGRSSLKWSKSIDRHPKQANEEATRAVVDVDGNKRECHRDASVCSEPQSGNQFLYDKSSCSNTLQSKKIAENFYNPRRLVIGNDEYLKIGNGNQLVRDPKRRARILANEKIRWSLHTARQRLAKKRKYCQFFTRFGKCDKDGGKCPYIHDTSKIAVCTKFLNGFCSNPSCKLTHKVIPERMPDCSYFLQGLCSSKNCAYRHVNVNSKANTCEGFLKGYCALGNECRKKHSYVCPLFEATGTCPDGSKCRLHHPKKQTKARRRKPSEAKNNDQGRYFDSHHIDISGSRLVVTEKHLAEGDLAADYISLDASDEEVTEANDLASGTTSFGEDYFSELLLNDLDELIKPVRIMNKNLTMQSSDDSGSFNLSLGFRKLLV